MKAEDIIVAYNGQPVKDGDDLVGRVSQTPIGSESTVTVDRGGKKVDLKVRIADREDQVAAANPNLQKKEGSGEETDKPETTTQAKFGISIRPTTDAERESAEMGDKKGVVITQVQEGSFADEIGLYERDIIVSDQSPAGGRHRRRSQAPGQAEAGRPGRLPGHAAESDRHQSHAQGPERLRQLLRLGHHSARPVDANRGAGSTRPPHFR